MNNKLLIQAANNYTDDFVVVPINSLDPVEIQCEFGTFQLLVCIEDFRGSSYHETNSFYNIKDAGVEFDGDEDNETSSTDSEKDIKYPEPAKLSFDLKFTPNQDINGSQLLFGNDCCYSIKDHVPTASLNTGLKLFNWFVNNTVRGNLNDDKPFLYGPLIGAATYAAPLSNQDQFPNKVSSVDTTRNQLPEHLVEEYPNAKQRKHYFNKLENCSDFTYKQSQHYHMKVDSNLISMSNCKYAISLPTVRSKRFNVDVGKYVSKHFNNFNWVVKLGGEDGVDQGTVGLVVNFKVIEES